MSTKIALLRAASRRPLLALSLVLAPVGLVAAGLATSAVHGSKGADYDVEGDANPRAILNRVWFDSLPEKRTDEVKILILFRSGVGVYEQGSVYRASFDLFEFERNTNKLDITFYQDQKRAATRFKVTACNDKPPFDLCVDFDDPFRGPKRLYGFGDADDLRARVPWADALAKAAEDHTRLPQP